MKKLEEYYFVFKYYFVYEFILEPCEIAKCLCLADKHGAIPFSKEKWWEKDFKYKGENGIENLAKLCNNKIIDNSDCEHFNEEYLFLFEDNSHNFYIGLSNILYCLLILEKEQLIPKQDDIWWVSINNRYGIF